MIEARIRETRNLDQVLQQVEPKLARNVARRAVRAGANVVRDEARRRAPVGESKLLRRSITTKLRSNRPGQVRASVGVFTPPARKDGRKRKQFAFYARWVEKGHRIVARGPSATHRAAPVLSAARPSPEGRLRRRWRRVGSLRERRRAAVASGRRVAGRPFLEPALVATHQQVHQVVMAELARGLGEVV